MFVSRLFVWAVNNLRVKTMFNNKPSVLLLQSCYFENRLFEKNHTKKHGY